MKRVLEVFWEILSFVCWVAFILSSVYGMSIFFDKYSLFVCLALLFILSHAFSKKKKEKTAYLTNIMSEQLNRPEYDQLSSLAKHDILKIIQNSNN